jgi:hypothetical protein
MPAILRQAPTGPDTTVPGQTRRRLWSAPAVRSHSVVCLTLSKLYVAPANAPMKPEAVKALETSFDLEESFGPLATVVDLPSIIRVRLDLLRNILSIDYRRQSPQAGPLVTLQLEFDNGTTADEVYSKLWRRLGDGVKLVPQQSGPWELARVPVAFMAGVLVATLALCLAANALTDTAHPETPNLLAPFARTDWRWLCGFSGVVLAGLQIWLYRRLTKPPKRLELARAG